MTQIKLNKICVITNQQTFTSFSMEPESEWKTYRHVSQVVLPVLQQLTSECGGMRLWKIRSDYVEWSITGQHFAKKKNCSHCWPVYCWLKQRSRVTKGFLGHPMRRTCGCRFSWRCQWWRGASARRILLWRAYPWGHFSERAVRGHCPRFLDVAGCRWCCPSCQTLLTQSSSLHGMSK